jgi:hypothetical protein
MSPEQRAAMEREFLRNRANGAAGKVIQRHLDILEEGEILAEIDECLRNNDRAGALKALSRRVGFDITDVTRPRGEHTSYRICAGVDSILLPRVQYILEFRRFAEVAADLAKVAVRLPATREDWVPFAQALLDLARDEVIDPEATERGSARLAVEEFLESFGQHLPDFHSDLALALRQGAFRKDSKAYVVGTNFRGWLKNRKDPHSKLGAAAWGDWLRRGGFVNESTDFESEDVKKTTRSCWTANTAEQED